MNVTKKSNLITMITETRNKMKKVTVLLILSLAICLAACGKKVSTPDEMLDVVKEKENISAEVDMIECGRIVDNDTTIAVSYTHLHLCDSRSPLQYTQSMHTHKNNHFFLSLS